MDVLHGADAVTDGNEGVVERLLRVETDLAGHVVGVVGFGVLRLLGHEALEHRGLGVASSGRVELVDADLRI